VKLFTIGFTRKSAERFFALLRAADVRSVIDVRLNNRSQLAGFAKKGDLAYFLRVICGMDYVHQPALAPTPQMLDQYRKRQIDWPTYERQFLELMAERRVEEAIAPDTFAGACLLCSEDKPHQCHRRLVAEYLQQRWGGVDLVHLW
jgi:uncharacterized protein (DUF488 family)